MKKKFLGVCMVAVVLLFGLQIFMERLFTQRLQEMTQTMGQTETMEQETEAPERIFAIFGIDQTQGDAGRSDCILLASMDDSGLVRMCSIARDTLVTIPGTGEETKLGHAYAMGGPELALETLNKNFDLDLEDYVSVNFTGMQELVDLMGGVELKLTEAEWKYLGLPEPYLGIRRLQGADALRYSRIRAIDSDDVRTGRQRNVIMAMLKALRSMPRTALPELVVEGINMCRTNVDILTIMDLAKDVLNHGSDLEAVSMSLPGDSVTAWGGKRPDGVWYYVYDLNQAAGKIHEFFCGGEGNAV